MQLGNSENLRGHGPYSRPGDRRESDGGGGIQVASESRQYRALLEASEAIAHHNDLASLFHELARCLHPVVEFDYLSLVLHDDERNTMRLHVLETTQDDGNSHAGKERPVAE